MRKRSLGVLAGALLLAASSVAARLCQAHQQSQWHQTRAADQYRRLARAGLPELRRRRKRRSPYCPNLAALGTTGVNYLTTSTSTAVGFIPRSDGAHDGRLAAHDGCQL